LIFKPSAVQPVTQLRINGGIFMKKRTWQQRFDEIKETAAKTASFAHNLTCQRDYFQLLAAVERKDAPTTKRLIERMGF
jgi:hypothetical protein